MSLYNALMGVNEICVFFILPMLGKHPDEYPRFRDCFIKDDEYPEYNDHIHIFTRVGGGNRNCGFGEEKLYEHPDYVDTFDSSFDSTYGTYVFKVPEKWKADFNIIKEGKLREISKEYKDEIYRVYPKLKDKFDLIFEG